MDTNYSILSSNNSIISEDILRSEIDMLRQHGYSEDEILLLLMEERCRNESKKKVKSKKFSFGGSTR